MFKKMIFIVTVALAFLVSHTNSNAISFPYVQEQQI